MLFIFSTPGLIRHRWQLKTVVFLHWCLIRTVPFNLLYQKSEFFAEESPTVAGGGRPFDGDRRLFVVFVVEFGKAGKKGTS